MNRQRPEACRVWTVAEARSRLSEVLRRAEEEGPQQIGRRRAFVVVPAAEWYAKTQPRLSMGRWLVENMPRGADLDASANRLSRREVPFAEGTGRRG